MNRIRHTSSPAWFVPSTSPDSRLGDAGTDLIDTIAERPAALHAALRRFGYALGTDGWPIEQVIDWVRELLPGLPRRRRRALGRYTAHAALAQGWAEGYVRGAHTGMCIDPITGLATMMVLRLRLEEVYAQCRSLGVHVADVHCLVVVDVDLGEQEGLEADLTLACVADAAQSVFDSGETVARVGNRVVILASRTEMTDARAALLTERLDADGAIPLGHPMVLTDVLPDEVGDINRVLRDLVY